MDCRFLTILYEVWSVTQFQKILFDAGLFILNELLIAVPVCPQEQVPYHRGFLEKGLVAVGM